MNFCINNEKMYLVIFSVKYHGLSDGKICWKVYCMSFQMRYSFLSYGKLLWRYNFLKMCSQICCFCAPVINEFIHIKSPLIALRTSLELTPVRTVTCVTLRIINEAGRVSEFVYFGFFCLFVCLFVFCFLFLDFLFFLGSYGS